MPAPALGTEVSLDLVVDADSPNFYILHLDPDGSRRIIERNSTGGDYWERGKERIVGDGLPAVTWGLVTDLTEIQLRMSHYLPYPPADGVAIPAQEEPVNQWGYLPEWRSHVGRFAHGFDALPGFESFNQLSAAQKSTAFRVGQTIGGHAWERLAFWLTYDPALSDDWKLPLVFDPVKKAVDAVCIECQSRGRRAAAGAVDRRFRVRCQAGRRPRPHDQPDGEPVGAWRPADRGAGDLRGRNAGDRHIEVGAQFQQRP